jgi:hypothetical protein
VNVFVQLANKRGFKKENFKCVLGISYTLESRSFMVKKIGIGNLMLDISKVLKIVALSPYLIN